MKWSVFNRHKTGGGKTKNIVTLFPRKPFCLQFFINKSKVCNDLRGSGPSCGSLSFDRYYRLNFLRKEINTGMKKR
jgi:hypothetical protein